METDNNILEKRGIKPTANRILVLRSMLDIGRPVSLSDLETAMPDMDKSSIFRVLTLFADNNLAHAIEDGSGVLKYEICESDSECDNDMHIHFYCEKCQQTFCFKAIRVPQIDLPEGFCMKTVNYMIKGVCPDCADK